MKKFWKSWMWLTVQLVFISKKKTVILNKSKFRSMWCFRSSTFRSRGLWRAYLGCQHSCNPWWWRERWPELGKTNTVFWSWPSMQIFVWRNVNVRTLTCRGNDLVHRMIASGFSQPVPGHARLTQQTHKWQRQRLCTGPTAGAFSR